MRIFLNYIKIQFKEANPFINSIDIENELLNFKNIVKKVIEGYIFELIINFVEKIQIILNGLQGLSGLETLLNKLKVVLIDPQVV